MPSSVWARNGLQICPTCSVICHSAKQPYVCFGAQTDIPANYRRALASGSATSRAHLRKSCATGLIVRPFRLTIPTGLLVIGRLIGRAFERLIL